MKKRYTNVWGYCECGVCGLCNIVDNGIGITDAWGVVSRDIRLEVESECCDGTMFFDEELTQEITIDDIQKECDCL